MEVQVMVVCSRLVGDDVVQAFRQLAIWVRAHCAAAGLTGMLLFDGENVVQLIEGAQAQVHGCVASLCNDLRLVDTHVLATSTTPAERLFDTWRAGYAEYDALSSFVASGDGTDPATLVSQFVALCRTSDFL